MPTVPLKPIVEAAGGVVLALLGVWGGGIAIVVQSQVLGPNVAITVGTLINIGAVIGGAAAIFHAGGIWREWKREMEKARSARQENSMLAGRVAALEHFIQLHGMTLPGETDDEKS